MEVNDKHSQFLNQKDSGGSKGYKFSIMWNREEDLRLQAEVEKCGAKNWYQMVENFPGRTA